MRHYRTNKKLETIDHFKIKGREQTILSILIRVLVSDITFNFCKLNEPTLVYKRKFYPSLISPRCKALEFSFDRYSPLTIFSC